MEETKDQNTGLESRTPRWWEWGHVLSLEAPLVAVLWQLALADLHGVRLFPSVVGILGLTVWWIYGLDRTLDALRAGSPVGLDVRHAFYQRFRWLWVGLLLPAGAAGIAWLAVAAIPEGMLWQGLTLGLLAMLYLAAYSAKGMRWSHALLLAVTGFGALILIRQMPGGDDFKLIVSVVVIVLLVAVYFRKVHDERRTLLPKPIAAAIIFALGCTLANRFFAPWDAGISSRLEELMLVCLFASNLTGIRVLEMERGGRDKKRVASAAHLHRGVLVMGGCIAALTLSLALTGSAWDRLAGMSVAVGFGWIAMAMLHSRRVSLSEAAYRFWADAGMLVPIPILLLF